MNTFGEFGYYWWESVLSYHIVNDFLYDEDHDEEHASLNIFEHI